MRTESGILEAVQRRCVRTGAAVHHELAQPLNSLASVASTAFFFGIVGNLVGIVSSFTGGVGEKSAYMAALAQSLSESMWPTAFSLLVGLMALGFYGYLSHRLSICDIEMQCGTDDLIRHLRRYRPDVARSGLSVSADPVRYDESSDRRWMLLAFPALVSAFCLEMFHFAGEGEDWRWVLWAASIHVLFTFSLSCIPAQFLWMKFFHRQRGWLMAVGAALCLCWCLSEVIFEMRVF